MKARRLLAILVMVFVGISTSNAQGWLGKVKEKAVEAGKRAVEQTVKDKTSKTDQDENEDAEESASPKKTAKGEAVKSDFVQGTVVIFEDNLKGEQMGEFPSKWDLIDNNAEVAKMNGMMAIRFEHKSPLW